MELSAAVSDGVQVAGSASLDEKNFQELVKQSVRCTLEPDACTSATEEITSPAYKEALFGLSTLLLELARLDVDVATLSSYLEDCKYSPERAKHLTRVYLDNKDALRSTLERVGCSPPHVVDVQWRLDYYLKNNHVERVSRPEYLIHFSTEGGIPGMQFACTQEQLQDLVLKLKDATKTLDKYIQH